MSDNNQMTPKVGYETMATDDTTVTPEGEQQRNQSEEIPSFLICPITQDVFTDPYIAMDGITYERSAIETWLQTNTTSPSFNTQLPSRTIIPNIAIRNALDWHKLSRPVAPPPPPFPVSSRRQQAFRLIQSRFQLEGWGEIHEHDISSIQLLGREEYFTVVNSAPGDRYGYGDPMARQHARLAAFGWGNKAVVANLDLNNAFVTTMGFHRYYWDLGNHQHLGLPRSDEYGFEGGSKQDFTLGYSIWKASRGCYHELYR